MADLRVLVQDLRGRVLQNAGDRAQQSGLACAVRADDRHRLARSEADVDSEERLEIAVVRRQFPGFQQRHQISIPR